MRDVSPATQELMASRGLRAWLEALNEPVLRALTAHAPDAIFVLDLEQRIQFINWTAGGLTVERVMGTDVYSYVPAEQRPAMRECFDTVRRTQKAGCYQNVYTNPEDGSVSFWDSRVAPVLQQGEVLGFVVISSNVTERRAAAHQRELLFSVSLDMLCIAGFDGYFKRINPAFAKTLQFSEEELLRWPLLELVHPDDVAATNAASEALQAGHDVIDFENRYRRKDGRYRTLSWRATADPETKMIFGVARDVTEQRALELQVRQSQKMDAVGQLAGGLAHDFNNLLLAIMVNTEAARQQLGLQHPLSGHLQDIERASERASDLVKQLLAFSRRRPSRMVPLELDRTLSSLLAMLRRLLPESVELTLSSKPGLCVVLADPVQVEQVLLNLCLNARDAMPSGGRLALETETVQLDDPARARELGLSPGRYTAVHVSDNGSGMSAQVRERIFEPFFTTKQPGKGTGLGLATAYAIVKQHSGALVVESQEGVGSRFSVYLPSSNAAPLDVTPPLEPALPTGQGTILVAEDDDLVRAAVCGLLSAAGYDVLEARDGAAALELLDSGQAVDLVLLDVVMPKLGGPQTLARLRERWPALNVILSSGYRDGAGVDSVPKGMTVLEKPYRSDELLRRIQAELEPH